MAGNDPVARLGLRTGWVPLAWARREHAVGRWADSAEIEQDAPAEDGPAGPERVSR